MNYQDVVQLLRAEANRLTFMSAAADAIEQIGSIEQHVNELLLAKGEALREASDAGKKLDGLLEQVSYAESAKNALVSEASAHAEKLVESAKADADKIIADAKVQGKKTVQDIISSSQRKFDSLNQAISAKQDELNGLSNEIATLTSSRDAITKAVVDTQSQLDALKAQIAKLLQG